MVRSRAAAVLALTLAPTAAVPAQPKAEDVRVVLKFVKRDGVDGPAVRFDPASCPACRLLETPLFNADNPRETVVALRVPRQRTIELTFDGRPGSVRQVLLEAGDLAFSTSGRRVVVPLPPLAQDAITAAEIATHIVEPGMVLRFEHADPARRAGAYATGIFPDRHRRAADVLEFAQREVVRTLELGEKAERRGWGTIQIMGFDTNAPHGHVDAPPHVHMHLRWPGDTGTQIAHYYLDADGLISHNLVGIKGLGGLDRRFGPGEIFATIAPDGTTAYTHRITERGWLEVGDGNGRTCLIRPISQAGFTEGAIVSCPDGRQQRIAVNDDLKEGVLTVTTDDIVEVFRYEPATGRALSPYRVPPSSPSIFSSGRMPTNTFGTGTHAGERVP